MQRRRRQQEQQQQQIGRLGYISKPASAACRAFSCPVTIEPCESQLYSIRFTVRVGVAMSLTGGAAAGPRNWTLRGAVLLLALQLIHTPNALQHTEEGLELLFRERSQSDWENVWHQETHSRCRDKLVRQLYWACEKDIYRLTRRNRKRAGNELLLKDSYNPTAAAAAAAGAAASTWLHVNYANMLLRSRRSDAPSITNECCTRTGCTWEEYAEYCPSNKRRNHY